MTRYNSSKYRVVPLMDAINGNLESINKLLALVGFSVNSLPIHCFYGDFEKKLKPTKKHLIGLVDYLRQRKCNITDITDSEIRGSNERRKLFFGSETEKNNTANAAKAIIEKEYDQINQQSKGWYIFEGYTHPDVFLEGEDYIILCEGKWTEAKITNETTHLKNARGEQRNQMIRHIQATLNYCNTEKLVYAFYIVDSECGYLDALTKDAFCKQLNNETIQLPEKEKELISSAFYGYTTWQKIKTALPCVNFPSKEEIDMMRVNTNATVKMISPRSRCFCD